MKCQKECLDKIDDSQNVILSSPTGSGKTRVYLEWAKNKNTKPIIYQIKGIENYQM